MIRMADAGIDLSLAVNYLPACTCAVECVVLTAVLSTMHSVRVVPGFVPVCLALLVHRASPRTLRVFDGNGVLLSIFLSHCVAAMQDLGEGWWTLWPAVYGFLSVVWPSWSGYLLFHPPKNRGELLGWLGVACAHVSVCGFVRREDAGDHRLVRVCRDLLFASTCVWWTYVVGIFRKRLSRDPAESACYFAVYFWPVLFVHPYAGLAYGAVCLGVVGLQLRAVDPYAGEYAEDAGDYEHGGGGSPGGCAGEADILLQGAGGEPLLQAPGQAPAPDEADLELFRQAMSARGRAQGM